MFHISIVSHKLSLCLLLKCWQESGVCLVCELQTFCLLSPTVFSLSPLNALFMFCLLLHAATQALSFRLFSSIILSLAVW